MVRCGIRQAIQCTKTLAVQLNPIVYQSSSTLPSSVIYRRLLNWVLPHWRIFSLAIFGMILTAVTEPMFPALMKYVLDRGFSTGGSEYAMMTASGMVGIFLLRGLAAFFGGYAMAWVAARTVMDMRRDMFSHLLNLPASFFDGESTGTLISKVAYDVTNVTQAATTVLTTIVRDSLSIAGLLGYLLYLDWKMTLIALTVGPFIFGVIRAFGKRLRLAARTGYSAMGLITHILEESVGAHKVVKVFGGQKYESKRFQNAINLYRRANMREAVASSATVPLTQLAASISVAIITYFALANSTPSGGTTAGTFISFITALLMLLAPVKRLTEVSAPLQRGLAAAESVFEILDQEPEDDQGKLELSRANGRIRFERVNFIYPEATFPALKNIELDIGPGQTVALVGASGSGKTTLASLIPRFYHPSGGRICIDSLPIEGLTLESLRANVALVSQDVVLFNDSVRANIAYGASGEVTSEEEIVAAAKAANAWEFIMQMENGLDTEVGENGVKLSGGQRQRLAIARAFLKNAPILILDEATSALDSESERQIQAALDTLIRGRTTLVIAHRLSTIERADLIVVMANGEIVERGTHNELLAEGGAYARLQLLQHDQGSNALQPVAQAL